MPIVIKKEFLNTKVAFGSNAKRLSERTQEELEALALMARQSNSVTLIGYFDKLPSLKELQSKKTERSLAEIKETSGSSANSETEIKPE